MKIVRTSKELTPQETYFLTMAPTTQKMKDCVSQVVEFTAFCIYEDKNSKDEEQTILSIVTPEREVIATNSPTFIEDFVKMYELFEGYGIQVNRVKVVSGTSKGGREFITCVYAETEVA